MWPRHGSAKFYQYLATRIRWCLDHHHLRLSNINLKTCQECECDRVIHTFEQLTHFNNCVEWPTINNSTLKTNLKEKNRLFDCKETVISWQLKLELESLVIVIGNCSPIEHAGHMGKRADPEGEVDVMTAKEANAITMMAKALTLGSKNKDWKLNSKLKARYGGQHMCANVLPHRQLLVVHKVDLELVREEDP